MALELSENVFQEEVINSGQPVLVDFWAPWCGPCKSMAPVLEEIAVEFQGRLKVGKVNVDNNQGLARQFGVMSIPTLIVFKEGKVAGQVVGFMPRNALSKKLEGML